MRSLRRFIGIAAVIAAVAQPVSAGPNGFSSRGGPCFQGALALTAPTQNLRRFVPDDFPLLEVGGRAAFFVYTVRCDNFAVGSGRRETVTLTGVAAFVLPPDGSLGVQAYDILMTTDGADYFEAVASLGQDQGFVDVGFYVTPIAGPVVKITADTPWIHSPYRWTLTSIRPPNAGISLPTVHWQDGRRGRVRIDYSHTRIIATPGVGRVTAAPGTPLAQILGTETATAAGAILQFSFTGTNRLTR